ncbi:MAG: response regulator [Amphiplicatus sp.]|uniref:response regulator n=1 Tax=Methylocystis sp. TaxID=1911079 RepID=UPI003D0BBDEF
MAVFIAGSVGLILGAALAWFFGVRRNRKAFETESQRKSSLLNSAAQQLRTPLNDVLGLVQTLSFRAKELAPETKELVEAIAGAGANAKAILLDVYDILDFESGQLRIKRGVELLPEVVDYIARTNRDRADKAGVELSIELDKSARAWFVFDSTRLRQCVAAMVRQAILQSDKGGRVKVSFESKADPKNKKFKRIIVTVSDNSAGLEQRLADYYFSAQKFGDNPFLKLQNASPLSLVVARLIARQMSGALTAKSAPGKGVVFRLDAPAKFTRSAEDEAARLSPLELASSLMRDKVVLAVEDNVVNMKVLQAFLARTNPKKVLTAGNGREAIVVLAREHCDVVLMDVQMPVMDGIAATKEIRASKAPWRDVPIIAISAAAQGDEREACIEAGMTAFLPKPVSAEELYERLARVCAD